MEKYPTVFVSFLLLFLLRLHARAQLDKSPAQQQGPPDSSLHAPPLHDNGAGGQEVPVPTPAAAGKNPSGVNMTELINIQAQMDDRTKTLEHMATDLEAGLDIIEQQAPKNLFQGVDLDAEVVDPKEIGQRLTEYKKAQEDKTPKIVKEQKAASQAYVGELTPPIIILEPAGEDPLQKYLLMKLLMCKQVTKQITERKKAIKIAQKRLGVEPKKQTSS